MFRGGATTTTTTIDLASSQQLFTLVNILADKMQHFGLNESKFLTSVKHAAIAKPKKNLCDHKKYSVLKVTSISKKWITCNCILIF